MRTLDRLDARAALIIGAAIAALTAWAVVTLPLPAVGILSGAALVAYAGWWRTARLRPIRSRAVVAAYLTAVAFQIVHLAEEWNQDFPHEFTDLVGSDRTWELDSFLAVFVFGAGALWVLAGAGALYGSRLASYFVWFYALGAGLINAIAHFVLPLFEGGYFPGLITAPGHLILSILLVRLLVIEDRSLRLADDRQGHDRQHPGRPQPDRAPAEPSVPVGAAR